MRRPSRALLALAVLSACGECGTCRAPGGGPPPETPAEARGGPYRRIDAHAHIGPDSTEEALAFYRRFGVEVAVNVSGRYPGHGLEEAVAAARASRGHLYFMCNIPWTLPVDHPLFADVAIAALEACREQGGLGWKIFKMLGLGAQYSDGSLVPVDAPELDPIFERASELGMPVLIHSGDPQAFFQPPTPDNERWEELQAHPGWSFHGPPYPSWEEIYAQFERRVARHPSVTFIGAHFGNCPEQPERVAAMLDRYPNLVVDTAARLPEIGRYDARALREIFLRHQDRILFATDLGYGQDETGARRVVLGSSGSEPSTDADAVLFWTSTWRFFETHDRGIPSPTPIQGRWTIDGLGLPPAVLEKIYRRNAERVLRITMPD